MSDSLPATANDALVCTLSSMDVGERQRHEAVIQQLFQSPKEVRELSSGFGVQWEMAKFQLAAEFITREHVCCEFFNFGLSVEAGADSFWLDITGGDGVKDMLRTGFKGIFSAT